MVQLQVIGHCGKNAEVITSNNSKFVSWTIAHSEKWIDKNNIEQSKTVWINCTMRNAESKIIPFIKKGTKLFVQGTMDVKIYDTNKIDISCNVHKIELLSSQEKENQQ